MEHCIEVGTAHPIVTFRQILHQTPPLGDILVSDINMAPCSDRCCQKSALTIHCVDNTYGIVA